MFTKYIKYKTKYLNIKNINVGGSIEASTNNLNSVKIFTRVKSNIMRWSKAPSYIASSYFEYLNFEYLKNPKTEIIYYSKGTSESVINFYSNGINEVEKKMIQDTELTPGICYKITTNDKKQIIIYDNKNYPELISHDEEYQTYVLKEHKATVSKNPEETVLKEHEENVLKNPEENVLKNPEKNDGSGIRIFKENGKLQVPTAPHINAFLHLTNMEYKSNLTYKYTDKEKQYTITRENNTTGTYIKKHNNITGKYTKYLIGDFNNVKVFVNNTWITARPHQAWSYFMYLEKKQDTLDFHSYGSNCEQPNSMKLPTLKQFSSYYNLVPEICYTIKRDNNGYIIYEKNDEYKTQVRISDHKECWK